MPFPDSSAVACRRLGDGGCNRRHCRCRAGTASFPQPLQLVGFFGELGLFAFLLRGRLSCQAASSSGVSQPGSSASMRANKAAMPSGVVGQSSSHMPTVGPIPWSGSTSTRVPSGKSAGASRMICPFRIVPCSVFIACTSCRPTVLLREYVTTVIVRTRGGVYKNRRRTAGHAQTHQAASQPCYAPRPSS